MEKASKSKITDELLNMVKGMDDYTQLPEVFRQLSMAASAPPITAAVGFNPTTGKVMLALPPGQLMPDIYQRLAEALQQASQQVSRLALASERQLAQLREQQQQQEGETHVDTAAEEAMGHSA